VGKSSKPSLSQGILSIQGTVNGLSDLLPTSLASTCTPLSGTLQAFIQLENNRDKPNYNSRIYIRDLRLGVLPVFHASLRAAWMDSLITLKNLKISLSEGQISGKGAVVMDSLLNHQFTLSMTDMQLTNLGKIIFQESAGPGGIINGRLISSGPIRSLKDLKIESHLNLTQTRYQEKILPDISMRLSVHSGSASLSLDQGENKFKSRLQITEELMKGVYSLQIPRLETTAILLNISDLKGSIQAKGRISGVIHDPIITSEIWGEAIKYHTFPLDSLTASIVYHKGKVFIDNAGFSGHSPSRDSLVNLFPETGFKGGFTYQGQFSGPISNPEGKIQVTLINPEFGNTAWDEGDLQLSISEGQVNLDPLILCKNSLFFMVTAQYEIHSASGRLDASFLEKPMQQTDSGSSVLNRKIKPSSSSDLLKIGYITADFGLESQHAWRLKAKGTGIQLEKIFSVCKGRFDWKGTLKFELNASRGDQDLAGKLNFQAYSLGTNQTVVDSLLGTVEMKDSWFALNPLELYVGGNRSLVEAYFELIRKQTGEYTLTQESNIQGKAEGTDIDLQFLPPLLGLGIKVSGISNYKLKWRGTWGKPKLQGHLWIQKGTVRIRPEAESIQSLEANVSLSDSLLLVNQISGTIRDLPFWIQGRLTGSWDQMFQVNMLLKTADVKVMTLKGFKRTDSLNVQASINNLTFSLFQDFVAGIHQLDGQLNGQMSISGLSKNPGIIGHLDATNITFQPHFLKDPFTNGIIRVSFENNKISLDTLFFTMNNGKIAAIGNTTLYGKDIMNLDAELKVDEVKIHRPKEFKLIIQTMGVQLQREQDGFSIGGDIILGESSLLQNIGPKTLISFFQKVEQPLSTPPALLQKTHLNIRVRESDKLWINNNIARLRFHPELTFIGTLANPNLTGRLSIEEGYILYLDRKFNVKQGVLDFINPHQINPVVDFNAKADIKSYQTLSQKPYTISLSIQGPLDQAVTNLTSNPPLEKSDIITLLTVGATRKELTGSGESGKSSVRNVLEDRFGQISSSQVSGFASRQIGTLFDLKDMSIEGNLFHFGKSWGPRLVASKTVTDRMEISYATRVGHSNEQSIQLDYRLYKNLSIQGQTDQRGRSGIDFKFHWKHK